MKKNFWGKNLNGSKVENFDAVDLIVGLLRDKILFRFFFYIYCENILGLSYFSI